MVHLRKLTAIITQVALVTAFAFSSVADAKSNGREAITQEDLKEWLTYLASDELEGRNTFTEGLGLAAGYRRTSPLVGCKAGRAKWFLSPKSRGARRQK